MSSSSNLISSLIPFLASQTGQHISNGTFSLPTSKSSGYEGLSRWQIDACERSGDTVSHPKLKRNDAAFIQINLPVTKQQYGDATSLMKDLVKKYAISMKGGNQAYLAVKLVQNPRETMVTDDEGETHYCGDFLYTMVAIDDPQQREFRADHIEVIEPNQMFSICETMHQQNCQRVLRVHPLYTNQKKSSRRKMSRKRSSRRQR